MSVCVNLFSEPLAHPKPTIFTRLHKYKVNIPSRPGRAASIKSSNEDECFLVSLPVRCILSGLPGLSPRPGIFYATILVSWVSDGHIY